MAQIALPQNLNKAAQPPAPMPPPKKTVEKEESRFSFNEKIKLIIIIIASITIPVFGTLVISKMSYKKEFENYKVSSETQIEELRFKINYLTNPSIKKLEEYENIIKSKLITVNLEKEKIEKDAVYQDLIKKTKELDKQIIICNVHLQNIEIVKQNKYKEVDTLLEKLNKENIK